MKNGKNTSSLIEAIDIIELIGKSCQDCQEETTIDNFYTFLHEHIFPSLGRISIEIYFPNAKNDFFYRRQPPLLHPKELSPAVPFEIPANDPLLITLRDGGVSQVITGGAKTPEFLASTANLAHALFPIFSGRSLAALLYLGSKEVLSFPDHYILGIQTLAIVIGSRIKSLDTIARLKESTAEKNYSEQLQKALYEISERAHVESSEEDLYKALHAIVGRLINVRNFFIALRLEREGGYYIKFVYYFDEFDAHMQGMEFKIDLRKKHSMTGYLLQSGKPVVLTPENFDDFCRTNNISPLGTKAHSLVGVPFYLEHLAGVVLAQSYHEHVYTDKDKDLLAYVARHIGDALQRKKAIDDMREANQIFSLFLRYSPIHIYIKKVGFGESRIVKVSESYTTLLHKPSAELIGKTMTELFPAEFAATTTANDWEVVSSGTPMQKEEYLNGRTYSTIKFPIIQGGRSLLAGFSIDITEPKKMETALREKERRYRIIFEKSPLAVISYDSEGTVVDCNDKFVEMMGSTREKLLGFNTARQSTPKMREAIKRALSGEFISFEDNYTSITGGKTTFLRGLFSPVTPGHSPTDVIATIEDITELKKHEKELQKIEKLESLGVLAGGIAHDFNNILTGIMGNISFSQVLIDADHRAGKPLAAAEKAAKRAASLAQQLLTFAKGGEPNKKVVSLQRLIHDAVSLLLRGSNVKPIIDLAESLHSLQADDGQISQVLNNLIINAAQAMPGGGTLTITAANDTLPEKNTFNLAPGTYIKLQIGDEGCGISPDNLGKIFDPYFSTKASGTGLGLATAYSIIERHKGYISTTSTIGRGTTFTVYLPSIDVYPEEIPADNRPSNATGNGGRILVMDDEEMIRDIAVATLTFLGYEVTTCADGEKAIEFYRTSLQTSRPYTAVILDLTVPGGLGGKETAEHILTFSPTAHLIVSSGYSNDPIMADFGKYGFCGAIAKPYSIGDFERVLREVLIVSSGQASLQPRLLPVWKSP